MTGILTFINTINYGALLQAFAMQRVLDNWGISAEIIQYNNATIEKKEQNKGTWTLRKILNKVIIGDSLKSKHLKFLLFEEKHLKKGLVLNETTRNTIENHYDRFIVGSDQVWNQDITGNDNTYFLDFVRSSIKKISYAPSFGNTPFPESRKTMVGVFLKEFAEISVRESSGQELITEIAGRDCKVVLDPTLLLEMEEWKQIISKRPIVDKYILVYFPHNKKKCFEFVRKLKKKTGLKVIYLSISPNVQFGVKTIYDASPEEWLSYIYYAEYIVTGSFHGTAFSLNFKKQFFCENNNPSSRIGSLTSATGTYYRNIFNPEALNSHIDYETVTPLLDHLRTDSKEWLFKAVTKNG